MRNRSYADEAEHCRNLAAEYGDRSERPFLLSIAAAFDHLAGRNFHRPKKVIGPLGEHLTLEKLPTTSTLRWTALRKAEVVAAVAGGLLSLDEACRRYSICAEEFSSWQRAIERRGMRGLRVTRIQDHRDRRGRRRPG